MDAEGRVPRGARRSSPRRRRRLRAPRLARVPRPRVARRRARARLEAGHRVAQRRPHHRGRAGHPPRRRPRRGGEGGEGLARVPGDAFRRGQERQRLREHHTSAGRAGRGAQPGRRHRRRAPARQGSRPRREARPRVQDQDGDTHHGRQLPNRGSAPAQVDAEVVPVGGGHAGAGVGGSRGGAPTSRERHRGRRRRHGRRWRSRGRRRRRVRVRVLPRWRGPDGVPGGQGRGRERRGDCSGETRRRRVRARGAARSKVRAGDCRRRAARFQRGETRGVRAPSRRIAPVAGELRDGAV
mmetsp:Transcript_14651/g.63439  ORF Transcript_14651/g.63439 Transcript_14651/m.63439 type:complete len:297 (+) Transcript_14651:456-1346(+)